MTFPLLFVHEDLQPRDFVRLELLFLRTVLDFLPCEVAHFIPVVTENGKATPTSPGSPGGYPETWNAGVSMVKKQLKPVIDSDGQILFLPIWNSAELAAVAVISGGSSKLYGQYASEWLLERSRLISREFYNTKQWSHEPASGLLNALHLREEIDVMARLESGVGAQATETLSGYLFLVEIATRSKDADQNLRSIGAIGAYLDSLVGEFVAVHHLGAGVYGFIWHAAGPEQIRKAGYAILRKLKRRNSLKVHIGIAPLRPAGGSETSTENCGFADLVFVKTWEALSSARMRGNFALCSAPGPESEEHPLLPPSAKIMHSFSKLWRRENLFSIVLFQKDIVSRKQFPARIKVLVGERAVVLPVDEREIYIFLAGMDAGGAKEWVCELQGKIREIGIGTFSAGIASYPCPGFPKNETPKNARKALLHGNFSGPGTVTGFNGISLNISGDIHYNDGNLLGAIKEYRLGLNLDPDNINLLNSLGVVYAQLDKYTMAIPFFEKALTLNSRDFMALFNLGHAYLRRRGGMELAVNYFEKALAENNTYFDLLLQLGQIYCNNGQYKKAVTVLSRAEKGVSSSLQPVDGSSWERCEPWHDVDDSLGHGLVYRYLGEAYKGCGNAKQAMTYLQRATRYNSRDAAALSLLGELYLSEKQGMDIALSFCRQAVELDENVGSHWYRLALVLLRRKELGSALDAAQRCMRLGPKNVECLMLLATLHEKLKNYALARKTYERVLRVDGTNKKAVKALTRMNKKRR